MSFYFKIEKFLINDGNNMEKNSYLNKQVFIKCDWIYEADDNDYYNYTSILISLTNLAKKLEESGAVDCANLLKIFAKIVSLKLNPSSLNEPFTAQNLSISNLNDKNILAIITPDELNFFEEILDDVNEPLLKARIADILWLLRRPRNPKHAEVAICEYISIGIDEKTWNIGGKDNWERAARLALQIKSPNLINEIETKLFSAFILNYSNSRFMNLWIAGLLDDLKMDRNFLKDISKQLFDRAEDLKKNMDYHAAIAYFKLASKKFKSNSDESKYIDSLVGIAQCYELEANARALASNLVANSYYENAIQAYREIPVKFRSQYSVEQTIATIKLKISTTGKGVLDELVMFQTEEMDITPLVKQSINFVSSKSTPSEAVNFFIGLYPGAAYDRLRQTAKSVVGQSLFDGLFVKNKISKDGRVIAKIPSINQSISLDDPSNKVALDAKAYEIFCLEIKLIVQSKILPALNQIRKDHLFTRNLMANICQQSCIVPSARTSLISYGLWLGFEGAFDAAIHLLCPQLENIVRSELKKINAQTSNIDLDGIENENGLSTLMDMPEAELKFGKDLTFEIKCLFTDSLGFNLRNEVAHGLVDDDINNSVEAIYAWWMMLRVIIISISTGKMSYK